MNSNKVSPYLCEKITVLIESGKAKYLQDHLSFDILQKIQNNKGGSVFVSLDTAKKICYQFGTQYHNSWNRLNGLYIDDAKLKDKNDTLKLLNKKKESMFVLMREIVELEKVLEKQDA